MLADELGEALCLEGAGISHKVEAFNDGEPEGYGAPEGMEQREASEKLGFGREPELAAKLADIGKDVAVGKRDAFGFA